MVGKHAKKEVIELERQRKLLVNLMQFKGKKKHVIDCTFCSRGGKCNSAKILGEKLHNIQDIGKNIIKGGINPKGHPFAPI